MFRPLEVFIGLRYTRAKRRNHFISFISLVSILGIAVGVTALITVISVMNGFDGELRERILGMVSHATIEGVDATVRDWPQAIERAQKNPHVVGAAPYVEGQALIQGVRSSGALVRGIEPGLEGKVSDVGAHDTAFPWRTALADVQYTATWPYAQATRHAARYDRFVEKERAALTKWLGDSGYSNYADPSLTDYATAYWGDNLGRLKTVKKKYDPHDLFSWPQSVPLG